MEIHAKAVYDKQTIKKFVKNINLSRPIVKVLTVFIILLIIAYSFSAISSFITENSISVAYIIGIMFFAFYLFFVNVIFPSLSYRRFSRKSDFINEYTFLDEKMLAKTSSNGISSNAEYQYTAFFKVIETKDYIYPYISKGQVLIVDKSTITDGTAEQIRGAIIEKIGIKNYKFKK